MSVRWPSFTRVELLGVLAVSSAVALLQALGLAHASADAELARVLAALGRSPLEGPLAGDGAAFARALGVLAAWPVAKTIALNLPNPARGWLRFALLAQLSLGVFLVPYFAALWLARSAFAGKALAFDHALFSYEQPHAGAAYGGLVVLYLALRLRDEGAAQRARAAELEAKLAGLRLDMLCARLEPHFLYNALNAVSALMYEDVARTERALDSLTELLRNALSSARATWPLAEERQQTLRYLDIVEARFGDRVACSWALHHELSRAEVPRFLLQSLVENAVKHNQHRREPLHIAIEAEPRAGAFTLRVSDDGVGFAARRNPTGTGLLRLERMLTLLFGERARLRCERSASGGARVELELPWERA